MRRNAPTRITTPAPGVGKWLYLFNPDVYTDPSNGSTTKTYKVNLIYNADDPAAQELVGLVDRLIADKLAEEREKAKPQNKAKLRATQDLPYCPVLDESGSETGEIMFKFKMKAEYINKRTGALTELKPRVFDAKGNPILTDVRAGNGSLLNVNFEPYPYVLNNQVGVALRLVAVQIVKLVEYGGGSADSFGFGVVEDGDDLSTRPASSDSPFEETEEDVDETDANLL